GAGYVVMFLRVLFGVRDIHVCADRLHIERGKMTRIPLKPPAIAVIVVIFDHESVTPQPNGPERGVVHFDFPAVEVCGVQVMGALPFGDRAAFVNGAVFGIIYDDRCSVAAVPSSNRSVFGYKNETCIRVSW